MSPRIQLEVVLPIALLYLTIVGLGMMLVPQHFGVGAVQIQT